MVLLASVLAALLLASCAFSTPVDKPLVTAAFEKRVNKGNLRNVLQHDLARVRALIQSRKSSHSYTGKTLLSAKGKTSHSDRRAVVSTPVINEAVTYVAAVNIGNPARTYDLIVDTGSSNTWAGSRAAFTVTSTTIDTGLEFEVTYGSGFVFGEAVFDLVTLASGLTINDQAIGVSEISQGFTTVDGILGIGPVDLTAGTLQSGQLIPTVTDNLFSQGTISSNLVAVSFAPAAAGDVTNGELTFGGVDSTKFTGGITFTPVTGTSPASTFWGINQAITFKGQTILNSAGIVDTGTTLVLVSSDAFSAYLSASGGTIDANTGLITFTQTQFNALQPLNFVVNGATFSLSANAQIFPRSHNADFGFPSTTLVGVVNSLGTPSGQGFDFVNGQSFLERFYSVYDTANKRVGLATTPFTNATSN